MSENKMVSFDMERAILYDQRNSKLSALSASLHLQMRTILSGLPPDANILCVGVGTGTELLYLAKEFPSWQFTALDPAEAMLNLCKQKAIEADIDQRCTFHCGYIDSLPAAKPFDAATSILVSHFLTDKADRVNFFSEIAARLRSGGVLINADLSYDTSAPNYPTLMAKWLQLLKSADWPANDVDKLPEVYKEHVAMLPPAEVESLLEQAGFNAPILFSQSLFIHSWFSHKS
jgi:tRNA (cmo5U34)-methyltransferase